MGIYSKQYLETVKFDPNEELWNCIESNNCKDLIIVLKTNKSVNLNQMHPGKDNLTPLEYATKNGLVTIANILADPDCKKPQHTALHTAIIERDAEAVKNLLKEDCIESLLLQQDENGYYPLEYACMDFYDEIKETFMGGSKNSNLEKINNIIVMVLETHVRKAILLPYDFNHKIVKAVLEPAGNFNIVRIVAVFDRCLQKSAYHQHLYWLGRLYSLTIKDKEGRTTKLEPNFNSIDTFFREAASLLLKDEKNFESIIAYQIFKYLNSSLQDGIIKKESIVDEFIKVTNFIYWKTYQKLDYAPLWTELGKKKRPDDTPTQVNFPYDCYFFAITSIDSNFNEISSLENTALQEAIKYCTNYLINPNISVTTKKQLTINLINACEKVYHFINQNTLKSIVNCLTKNKDEIIELNYYLAKIYLVSKQHEKFLVLKNCNLDTHLLKNYLYAQCLIQTGKEKEVGGKLGIINLLQTIPFLPGPDQVDSDQLNEFIAAKTFVVKLLKSYTNEKSNDIADAAKKALQLFKSQTPTAPQLCTSNQPSNHLSLYPHELLPVLNDQQTIFYDLSSISSTLEKNTKTSDSLPPPVNPELLSEHSFKEESAMSPLCSNITDLKNTHYDTTSNTTLQIASSPEFEKDETIHAFANKSDYPFNIPSSDKTDERLRQLEMELQALEERKKQIMAEQSYLNDVKKFDQKRYQGSCKKRAKEVTLKRYKEFFIFNTGKNISNKSNGNGDYEDTLPIRADCGFLKNLYTP